MSTKAPISGPHPYLSLIVAAYNTDQYIERLITSILNQSSELENYEIIIVDDGSQDRTAEVIAAWMERFPQKIKYIYQENAGAGAARNTGLDHATGEWVCFPDSDDFLDNNYFAYMIAETEKTYKQPLLAVISTIFMYYEEKDKFGGRHPLYSQLVSTPQRVRSHDMGERIHLSGATIWLHGPTLRSLGLKFDHRVVPNFEDAHMINKFFLAAPNRTVTTAHHAKYFYRKRSDSNSLIDAGRTKPEWYLDQLKYGSLDLLKVAKHADGSVPKHIQRTILYDVFHKIKFAVNNPEKIATYLTPEQTKRFEEYLFEIFADISQTTIENFRLAGCTEEHKVGLISLFKNTTKKNPVIYLTDIDIDSGMAQFRYYSGNNINSNLAIQSNGTDISGMFQKCITKYFSGKVYYNQISFWIPFERTNTISFSLDGEATTIRRVSRDIGKTVTGAQLLKNAEVKAADMAPASPEVRALRDYVQTASDIYQGCTVLMDRFDRADDNAEHLYRYLITRNQSQNIWFILSKDSPDWGRLSEDGFRLLEYGSKDHLAALFNAAFLISSHTGPLIQCPVPRRFFGDLINYKFIFLQHGVAIHDISRSFNGQAFRLLISASQAEYDAFINPTGPYKMSEREVVLTGLPRHDNLRDMASGKEKDIILVTPTWRKDLTTAPLMSGQPRGKIENFMESDYSRNWLELICSNKLKDLAAKNQKRIVFVIHPEMAIYLDDLDLPSHIETINIKDDSTSYQELFARTTVAVTDYSSTVIDIAYLNMPIVYFQFDKDAFFTSDHGYRKGYFSYDDDGFGPVVEDADSAFSELKNALCGEEDTIYAARRLAFFPYHDGKCCERVAKAIEGL